MLVIISDLHLTDGTQGDSLPAEAFQIFVERLRDLALAASHRSDGRYRPIEHLDLLLLGDVLDCIRSAHWLNGQVRPWSDPHSPEFFNTIARITGEILQNNELSIQILRALSRETAIQLPPGTESGRIDSKAEPLAVAVRTFYLVGNHDWFYHLPGPHYDRLRATVVEGLGLANPSDRPFPHDPAECETVLETMRRHAILARHGDIYDPFSFEADRNTSSLSDAVVIELIDRFVAEVERELAGDFPAATVAGLQEIDNIRPSLLTPVWIEGVLERTCPLLEQRKRVKACWNRLTDRFLSLDFVRTRDCWSPVDLVDGLARVLRFGKHLNTRRTRAVLDWLSNTRGPADASYRRHALAEQDFRNRRAKFIVYGHTHLAETVPLDASYAKGCLPDQIYFNTGTWRRVYRQSETGPAEHEFIAADRMRYLGFYQGDECGGRPYETWSDTLGLGDQSHNIRRLDAPHASMHAAPHTVLPRPSVLTPSRAISR